jgi:hypothetical protein
MFNSARGVSFSSGILRRPYKCIYSLYAQYSQTETAKRLGYKKCTEPVFIGDLAHWKILSDFKTKGFIPFQQMLFTWNSGVWGIFAKTSVLLKNYFLKRSIEPTDILLFYQALPVLIYFLKLYFMNIFLPSAYLLASGHRIHCPKVKNILLYCGSTTLKRINSSSSNEWGQVGAWWAFF